MPSFTVQIPNLEDAGPEFDAAIAISSALEGILREADSPIPGPVTVRAMIDTGASRSVVQRGLADQLGLKPIGITYISTPSSTGVPAFEYLVRLVLPNNVIFETTVLEAPLQGQGIQCLIGREVLSQGMLVYIGYSNLFSLSF